MAAPAVAVTADKYGSEYPLPGGVEEYFTTLVGLLRYIRDNKVTSDDLSSWMSSTFPKASGQTAVNGYIATLARLGLWSQQDDRLRLTAAGTTLLEKAESAPAEAHRQVVEIKYRDFTGYDALFDFLRTGPHDLDTIHEQLKQALAVDWKSKNQTMFRVNWLRSLGYVQKDGFAYRLTDAGRVVGDALASPGASVVPTQTTPPPLQPPQPDSCLLQEATKIADELDRLACAGGDGKDFELATEAAFRFLGFDTQLLGGSGNPDVVATANMGERSYRLLIDSKSRSSGVVQQNDVNLPSLKKQKIAASANFVVVVGADFAGGNLEEFARENKVRLLCTSALRELLLVNAQAVFPLDILRPLFDGGGATDDGVLSEILATGESRLQALNLARQVYAAVHQHQEQQEQRGAIHADSLFYILKGASALPEIKKALEFLESDLIAALGKSDRGSYFTRVSPEALSRKLSQLGRTLDLTTQAAT